MSLLVQFRCYILYKMLPNIAGTETFFTLYTHLFCLSSLQLIGYILSLGVVKYIGPVNGEKQSCVGLHLDSPGNVCVMLA